MTLFELERQLSEQAAKKDEVRDVTRNPGQVRYYDGYIDALNMVRTLLTEAAVKEMKDRATGDKEFNERLLRILQGAYSAL